MCNYVGTCNSASKKMTGCMPCYASTTDPFSTYQPPLVRELSCQTKCFVTFVQQLIVPIIAQI